MKPRHLALGAALLAAAALVAFGDRTPSGDIAEAVDRPAPGAGSARAPLRAPAAVLTASAAMAGRPAAPRRVDRSAADALDTPRATGASGQAILALVPRDALIGDSDTQFGQAQNGAGGDGAPFGRRDWTPPPPPPQPAPPPPPPTAPPLPFTFIGKALADGVWEVYLARGDRTYVVHDKETIEGAYRVDAIAPPVMTLTYLPLKQIQQLNIGVFD